MAKNRKNPSNRSLACRLCRSSRICHVPGPVFHVDQVHVAESLRDWDVSLGETDRQSVGWNLSNNNDIALTCATLRDLIKRFAIAEYYAAPHQKSTRPVKVDTAVVAWSGRGVGVGRPNQV